MRFITRDHIKVYKVLSQEFRAYAIGESNLEGYGQTQETAIMNLGKVLNERTNYGFNLEPVDR